MTRQTLLDGADARDAVEVLQGVRSVVDVNVYLWDDEDTRRRRLTFSEKRAMWALAHREVDSGDARSGEEPAAVNPSRAG
jgi:hypothetical protein